MKLTIVSALRTKARAITPYKVLVTIFGKASLIEVTDSSSSRSILSLKTKVKITKANDNQSRLG